MKEENIKKDEKESNNLSNNNINILKMNSNSQIDSEKYFKLINNYFDKIKTLKGNKEQNFDEIIENINSLKKENILNYIKNLNKEQIESIIDNNILVLTYEEISLLIKENKNINKNNDEDNKQGKEYIIFSMLFSLIKEIIKEYLENHLYFNFNNINEFEKKLFNFYFTELINISDFFYKYSNELMNDDNNTNNIIFEIILDIFILFLKHTENRLLTKTQKNQLFQNNLKLLINLEKYSSKIKYSIILKIIKILSSFYLYYSLDSEELKEINNNKFNEECLIKFKQFIINNIINYNQIEDIKTIIDFIEILILYENIYECNNNNETSDNNKLFNLSYINQLINIVKKKINIEENNFFKKQFESIINFLNEPSKKDNYVNIIKFKILNNENFAQLKQALKNIIEENNNTNSLTIIQKKKNILINENELLKQCYIIIKDHIFLVYNEIINFYSLDNTLNKSILCIEEKYIKLIELIKILKYLLIVPEEDNLLILIKDKIFDCIISIIDININGLYLFNDSCKEQAFAVFDIITKNENIIHNELIYKDITFTNYILKEYINYVNIFKNYLNSKQQNIDNNLITNIYSIIDKNRFKKISKIICELSKEKEFLKLNLQIINFTSLYLILLIEDIDIYVISLYINILRNYLILIQDDNLYLLTENDNNILVTLIMNIFNKNKNNEPIIIELLQLIDIKNNDEYFIKLLINNNLSKILFSIFSPFSEESNNNNNNNNNNYSQCIIPALNTIYDLLKYNFFIIELLNIGINNIINCLYHYIFNSKICEIFLKIILKIIENKEHINMLINKINLSDVKKIVINILDKYLDTCHKHLIKYSLEIIEFFIESPNNLINFSKSNDKNNTLLITCLFKCININYEETYIMDNSIKILFRYISYVKINKEKSRVNLLENKVDEDDDDDLPDDLFSEEYPQVLKIFKCQYFKQFIDIYLIKILENYLIKQKNENIIKNIIEIMRILINIIDSFDNLKILFTGIIDVLFKFLNIFLKYKENTKDNNEENVLDLIKHFTFLSYKIISINKEIIKDNVIIIISLVSIIVNNFKTNLELIERFLLIIYDSCLYGNKTQLIKSISIIKIIFDKLRELYEIFEIKKDKKEFIIFIFTNTLKVLSEYNLDILNNNILFIIKNIPIQNVKDDNINSFDDKNDEKYGQFSNNLLRLCGKYYIESNDEAILFLNSIKNLYNEYTSSSINTNKTNNEIRFLLCIIYDLNIKTSYLKEVIMKDNQSIFSQIKIYLSHLSKSDNNLNIVFEKCTNQLKAEEKYPLKSNDISNIQNKVRNILLIDKIKAEEYDKMRKFFLFDNIINIYTDKSCIKCKIKMDNNLRNIIISKENQTTDSIKIDSITKIINDNSNQAFTPKGFFSRKTKSSNCFSIYINNVDESQKEKNYNIECQNEEIASKCVKYFNILIELDKNINQIK